MPDDVNPPTADDLHQLVYGAPLTLPGAFGFAIVDVGCLECGETTVVRGVWSRPEDAGEAWQLEVERLEITRSGAIDPGAPGEWEKFIRAGGSRVIRWAHYRAPHAHEGEGHRCLSYIVTRIDP